MPDSDPAARPARLGERLTAALASRPLPIVLALATTLALAAGAEVALRRPFLRGRDVGRWLRSPGDDGTLTAHAIANLSPGGPPAVVLLGGSSVREGFESPEVLERQWRAAAPDRRWRVLSLPSSSQSLTEALAIAEALPLPRGTTLVVHLSVPRLAETRADAEAELASPRLPFMATTEVRALVRQAGGSGRVPSALRRQGAWLGQVARVRRIDWPAGMSPRRHVYPDSSLPAARKRLLAQQYALWLSSRGADDRFARSAALRLVALARSRGWAVAFVRLPSDPAARRVEAPYEARLQAAAADLVAAGARFVDLADGVDARDDYFHDLHHLRPAGRALVSRRLGAALAQAPRP